MNLCPKAFGCDMKDERNLAYCRSMQTVERCVKCEFYEHDKSSKNNIRDAAKKVCDLVKVEQARLF